MNSREEQIRQYLRNYLILGSTNCLDQPEKVLTEAIDGGITLFQFREKGAGALKGQAKTELGQRLRGICRDRHIPFIVNDDLELAEILDADGVHIGQEDEEPAAVRTRFPGKILGVSVHTSAEAAAALQAGADYFGIGPIYPTATKEDAKPPQGFRLIKELRSKGLALPIVGIGGITPENARSVFEAGADGVSVITAITHAPSVKSAAAALLKASH